MANSSISMNSELYSYLLEHGVREPVVLGRLREATEAEALSEMRSAPEQGQLMAMLIQLIGAKRVLEIGTYTGYATLWMALALPKDGRIDTCEISQRWRFIAHRFWEEAGMERRIVQHIGPATETLDAMIDEGQLSSYDFAFIDADKVGYDHYYEACMQLVRPGGLIVIDNVLWGGSVIDADNNKPETEAIRALNHKLKGDTRIEISMLPVADGITIVRRL